MYSKSQNTFIDIALVIIVIVAVSAIFGAVDYKDASKLEQHKQETIAAAKKSAHERAEELRHQKLLDDANKMMAPCCQSNLHIQKD